MTENQPAPSDKSQAEGDRQAVEEEIDAQGTGMPTSATVEQEIADSD